MQAEDIHIEDSFTLSDFFRGKLDLLVCKSVISLEEEDDDPSSVFELKDIKDTKQPQSQVMSDSSSD